NTLPSRVRLDASQDALDWLRRLQAETVETERFAYTPLAEALQCAALPGGQALFDSLYVFENYPGQAAFRRVIADNGLEAADLGGGVAGPRNAARPGARSRRAAVAPRARHACAAGRRRRARRPAATAGRSRARPGMRAARCRRRSRRGAGRGRGGLRSGRA